MLCPARGAGAASESEAGGRGPGEGETDKPTTAGTPPSTPTGGDEPQGAGEVAVAAAATVVR